MTDTYREYAFEYGFEGARWTLSIMAKSEDEAYRRLRQCAHLGKCYTPEGVAFKMPAIGGSWIANIVTGTLNLFNRRRS